MSVPKFVQYINLSKYNNNLPSADGVGESTNAEINTDWGQPIIKNANKYSICIERMEISGTSIPILPYDDDLGNSTVTFESNNTMPGKANDTTMSFQIGDWQIGVGEVVDVAGVQDGVIAGTIANPNPIDIGQIFSIGELIETVNSVNTILINDGSIAKFHCSISRNGFVRLSFNKFPKYYVVFGRRLAQLFGVPQIFRMTEAETIAKVGVNWNDSTETKVLEGNVSVFDRCIRNRSILIESDLPIVSDIIGQGLANVITDFVFPTDYTQSYQGTSDPTDETESDRVNISYPPPQRIVYTPSIRRFLEFQSPIEISRIMIRANYVSFNGVIHRWTLRPGEFFAIKLGLYLK